MALTFFDQCKNSLKNCFPNKYIEILNLKSLEIMVQWLYKSNNALPKQ